MIGFNGGLIGGFRDTTTGTASAPGVWTANEQVVARRRRVWLSSDPFFSSVSLLLPGDGTNGSTSIIDRSPSPKTITAFGNAQISTAQSKFGGSSIAFDGNGDYLSAGSNNDFNFETGAFTVECFVYFLGLPAINRISGIVGTLNSINEGLSNHWWLGIENAGGTNGLKLGRHFSSDQVFVSWTPPLNTWHYIAATRNASGTVNIFINGVSQSVTTQGDWGSINFTSPGNLWVGIIATSDSMNGFIDDLRITKGVARYTSNFTPPTAPHPAY